MRSRCGGYAQPPIMRTRGAIPRRLGEIVDAGRRAPSCVATSWWTAQSRIPAQTPQQATHGARCSHGSALPRIAVSARPTRRRHAAAASSSSQAVRKSTQASVSVLVRRGSSGEIEAANRAGSGHDRAARGQSWVRSRCNALVRGKGMRLCGKSTHLCGKSMHGCGSDTQDRGIVARECLDRYLWRRVTGSRPIIQRAA